MKYLRNSPKVILNHTQSDPHTEKCPQGDPKEPEVTLKAPKVSPRTPKVPQSDPLAPKVSPRSPKVAQRWSQVLPQGLPRPPEIDQKRSPRPSRDTFNVAKNNVP